MSGSPAYTKQSKTSPLLALLADLLIGINPGNEF
jgi:hypothetical protein